MSTHRFAVLRSEFKRLPGSIFQRNFAPPNWPNWAIQRLFDNQGAPPGLPGLPTVPSFRYEDRSISGFWRACTFGLVDFEVVIFPNDADHVSKVNATHDERRGDVIGKVRKQAEARGVSLDGYAGVLAWLYPPPSDAGASGTDSLFDENGWHGFYCHELGHNLGMDHPMGPGGVYDDPYCVMGNADWNRPFPPDPDFDDLAVPPGFWLGPRMASAANMFRIWEKEFSRHNMIQTGYFNQEFETDLVALSEAKRGDRILVAVASQPGTYFAEYRVASGWDGDVVPAVVIHSRDIRPNPWIPNDHPTSIADMGHLAGEVRPVYFEGAIETPFQSPYISHDYRFAAEVLDISSDGRIAKVHVGRPQDLRHRVWIREIGRQVVAQQVLDSGTKELTPETDPLLCEPGTYSYTRFDQAEQITLAASSAGFGASALRWAVDWDELVQDLADGETTLHRRIFGRRDYYLDLSLHSDVLTIRTRLAQPDALGRLHSKPGFELAVTVVAESPALPSGFVVRRSETLKVPLNNERVDYDSRYQDDVNLCYYTRRHHGRPLGEVDKLTPQPPWLDPSDPSWRHRLGVELLDRGRLTDSSLGRSVGQPRADGHSLAEVGETYGAADAAKADGDPGSGRSSKAPRRPRRSTKKRS